MSSRSMFVVQGGESPLGITTEEFVSAVQERWGEHAEVKPGVTSVGGTLAWIEEPESSPFEIFLTEGSGSASTNADPNQLLDVALLLRDLVPEETGLWMIDYDYSGHVAIHAGMSSEDLVGEWVEH
jgi:hypothetical protein